MIICGDGLSMRVERVRDDFEVFNLGWIVNYYKEYCKKWLRYEKKKDSDLVLRFLRLKIFMYYLNGVDL